MYYVCMYVHTCYVLIKSAHAIYYVLAAVIASCFTYIHTCILTYIRMYIHKNVHTYVRILIYVYTYR